jgi:hypothetical protein
MRREGSRFLGGLLASTLRDFHKKGTGEKLMSETRWRQKGDMKVAMNPLCGKRAGGFFTLDA